MRDDSKKRRTVLKGIGAGLVGSTLLSEVASADPVKSPPENPGDYPPVFPTWGSDGTDHHEMLDPAQPQNSNHHAHRPFYHIGPSGGEHSPHIFGLDNVVDTPSSGGGKYSAMWHVHFVFDASKPSPTPPGKFPPDGLATFTEPTVSKVEAAIESESDIYEIDSGIEFVCPVRPHHHGNGNGQGTGPE